MPRKNNIQFRKGSNTQWESVNPVLTSGEPGFDLNNNILKIGDGSKNWNQLLPIGGGDLTVLSEEPNGFVNKDHSFISVNFSNVNSTGSGIFSISPTGGVSSYDVFIKGLKYSFGSLTGYIPDTTALYFVYIDKSDRILKIKDTNPNFATDIPVSYVYWNTDNNQVVYQAEERHGIKMDSATHLYLHRVFGAQYISGLGLTYNSLVGNGSTDIDAKIAIANGLIFDEDDQINIIHSNNPNINNYEQVLSPTGQIPIFYRDGAAGGWKYAGPTNYPVKVGTSAQYNQYSGGSWTTTNAGNAKFIATWIVATNNMLYPIIGIMGQEADDNIGQADTDNLWENLDLTDLPVVEMRPLYRLIFETDSRWTGNASRVALRDVKDIRSVLNVTGGGLSPSDHGNLFGLLDDDHPQYVSIDSSRNISAIHNFTNGLLINNIPAPTGSGSNNYVTKWISSSGITSGIIYDNGTNIGIGTSSPSARLHTTIADGNSVLLLSRSSSLAGLSLDFTGNFSNLRSYYGLKIFTGSTTANAGTERVHFTDTGLVGIGTSSPSGQLHIIGSGIFSSGIRVGDSSTNAYIYGPSGNASIQFNNGGSNRLDLTSTNIYLAGSIFLNGTQYVNGTMAFPKTSTPTSTATQSNPNELRFFNGLWNGSSTYDAFNTIHSIASTSVNGASRLAFLINDGDGSQNRTERLSILSNGSVGIGTTNPGYKLQVAGSFGATTKSFRIDHPSKPGWNLEYGSLESPYHGVRLTGRGKVIKGVGSVYLPDYLKDLIHNDESLNIQITNIKHSKTLFVDKIELKKDRFIVKAHRAKTLGELEFFWTLTGTRKDVENLVVEKEN